METSRSSLQADVIRTLALLARVAPERIKLSDQLSEDLALDSLQRMEALSRISDQYALDPDLEKVMALRTVGDVIDLMQEHLPGAHHENSVCLS